MREQQGEPPVRDSEGEYVREYAANKTTGTAAGTKSSLPLWRVAGLLDNFITWQYFDNYPFDKAVKQSDATFSGLLTKIALPEEVAMIEKRFVTVEESRRPAPDAIEWYHLRNDAERYNET
ncbi:hypothetical protein MTO96_045283 [Rhipicephalus appendiculatus]